MWPRLYIRMLHFKNLPPVQSALKHHQHQTPLQKSCQLNQLHLLRPYRPSRPPQKHPHQSPSLYLPYPSVRWYHLYHFLLFPVRKHPRVWFPRVRRMPRRPDNQVQKPRIHHLSLTKPPKMMQLRWRAVQSLNNQSSFHLNHGLNSSDQMHHLNQPLPKAPQAPRLSHSPMVLSLHERARSPMSYLLSV